MSGPFSPAQVTSTPAWGELVAPDGNFTQVNVLTQGYQEVGYGEEGYGEGGYDAPTISAQGASEPNWTEGSLR